MADSILLALIAGTGFALAGMAGVLGVNISSPIKALSVAGASGILLAISFAELFPEAVEQAGHQRAVIAFLAGFCALFLVEVVTRGHTHHDQEDAAAHVHADCDDESGGAHAHAHSHAHSLLPFIVGLGIHNFMDGFAIGASSVQSGSAGGAVAIGVLIHQIPVGVSFAAVLAASVASRALVVRSAVGLGGAIVAGAVLVSVLPAMTPENVAAMGAIAAGALTYIGAGHLLPEAHREHGSVLIGIAFPVALLGTALLVLHSH